MPANAGQVVMAPFHPPPDLRQPQRMDTGWEQVLQVSQKPDPNSKLTICSGALLPDKGTIVEEWKHLKFHVP